MFDVNFSEILVILVVALIVIGPDRLPAVARAMGQWLGRIQRFVSTVKQDVNRSMELEELRELERKVKAEAAALEQSAQQAGNDLNQEVRRLEQDIESMPESKSPTPPASTP
jgi:sec-independent protein translocase protein TatB